MSYTPVEQFKIWTSAALTSGGMALLGWYIPSISVTIPIWWWLTVGLFLLSIIGGVQALIKLQQGKSEADVRLTVAELRRLLDGMPDDAVIEIHIGNRTGQRCPGKLRRVSLRVGGIIGKRFCEIEVEPQA